MNENQTTNPQAMMATLEAQLAALKQAHAEAKQAARQQAITEIHAILSAAEMDVPMLRRMLRAERVASAQQPTA